MRLMHETERIHPCALRFTFILTEVICFLNNGRFYSWQIKKYGETCTIEEGNVGVNEKKNNFKLPVMNDATHPAYLKDIEGQAYRSGIISCAGLSADNCR